MDNLEITSLDMLDIGGSQRLNTAVLLVHAEILTVLNYFDDHVSSLNIDWWIGGSLGLALVGLLDYREGDLDICVNSTDYDRVLEYLTEKTGESNIHIVTDVEGSEEGGHASFQFEDENSDNYMNICLMSVNTLGYVNYEAQGHDNVTRDKKWFKVLNPVYSLMAKTRYVFSDLEKDPTQFRESTIKRVNKHLTDLKTILIDRFNQRLKELSTYEV